MILAIDIGNTNISFAVFRGGRIIKRFDIAAKRYSFARLRKSLGGLKIKDGIFCSVVPQRARLLSRNLRRLLGKRPYYIGKNIGVPVENLYRCPRQAGQDRLVNAYAAIALYGTPLVVVDFGTAITFDVISKKGKYRGGMILPGLQASLDILAQRTALLPKVNLSSPGEFIGRDSRNGMLSGIIYGYAGLTKELIRQIRQRIGKGALAIGTGGNINLMRRYCRIFDKIDRDLTLRGLYLIYKRTRGVA